MNCLKCGGEVNTSLRCLSCGIQYELVEKTSTANTWYDSISDGWHEATNPYYNPEDEYVQWEN